jgi:hypothetical protein
MAISTPMYLSSIVDPLTGSTLATFIPDDAELDYSMAFPTAVYVVPGVPGGYDPRGSAANPMAPRKITFKFASQIYSGVNSYMTVRDNLLRSIGLNRRIFLMFTMPDGTFRRMLGKLENFPDTATYETAFLARFEMTFGTTPFFKGLLPNGVVLYDYGFFYDSGNSYDGSNSIALSANSQILTIPNNGTAPEYEARFTVTGPFAGPITFLNALIPLGGGQYEQMTFLGSLASGDVLLIDTGIGIVALNGVPAFGSFVWGAQGYGQKEWFRLDPGSNQIQIYHGSGAVGGSATCEAYDTWY